MSLPRTPRRLASSCATCSAWRWSNRDGWLIFALPPAELAFHPGPGWGLGAGQHLLFLMCHDIRRTVADLEAKGVEFTASVTDEGYGLVTRFKIRAPARWACTSRVIQPRWTTRDAARS